MSKKYLVKWSRIIEVSVIVEGADSEEEAIALGAASSEDELRKDHVDSIDFEASVLEDTENPF